MATAKKKTARKRGRPRGKAADGGREKLIEASRNAFRTLDPLTITRRDLAEHIGVDPNLIRYYFGNLHQLRLEVVTEIQRTARADMSAMSDANPQDRLRYRVRRIVEMFGKNPFHHKLIVASLMEDKNQKEYREWVDILARSLSELEDIIASGIRENMLIDTDARFLHILIISAAEFWTSNRSILEIFFGESIDDGLSERYADWLYQLLAAALKPPAGDQNGS